MQFLKTIGYNRLLTIDVPTSSRKLCTMDRCFKQNRPWLSLIDFSDVKGQKNDKIMKKNENNEKKMQPPKVHAGGDSKLIYYLAWPKRNRNWSKFCQHQQECKEAFRRAEWDYVNGTIHDGVLNNNTKPFWCYVKSKRQDNLGTSPLKRQGQLFSDSKTKAEIDLSHFSSVFTRATDKPMPPVTKFVDATA